MELVEGGEEAEEGGFAGAGFADDGVDFARVEGCIDVVEDFASTVAVLVAVREVFDG